MIHRKRETEREGERHTHTERWRSTTRETHNRCRSDNLIVHSSGALRSPVSPSRPGPRGLPPELERSGPLVGCPESSAPLGVGAADGWSSPQSPGCVSHANERRIGLNHIAERSPNPLQSVAVTAVPGDNCHAARLLCNAVRTQDPEPLDGIQ